MEHLQDVDCDICFVQETFLRDGDKAKLAEIRDYGWNIISNPRKHRSGGGIAMLYRNTFELKSNNKVTKYKSFQVMESLVNTDQDIIRLINIYRPPYTKKARYTECAFLEEFEDYLKNVSSKPGSPIIAGDFNFHMERPDDLYPKKLYQLLEDYQLHQHVPLVPTHDQGGTLDLVITSKTFRSKLTSFEIIPSRTTSDHFLVVFDADFVHKAECDDNKYSNYRKFKDIDIEKFKEDVINSELGNPRKDMSADDSVKLYDTVLTRLMDKHCPVIKKKIRKRPTPWIDLELRILRRQRRAAERAWRKGTGDRADYVKLRDEFTRLEFVKRSYHHRESLKASSGDTKTLYKKLNRLLGNESHDLPKHLDSSKLSEDFKDFFAEKVNKIRRDINSEEDEITLDLQVSSLHVEEHSSDDQETPLNCRFDSFSTITSKDLKGLVSKI